MGVDFYSELIFAFSLKDGRKEIDEAIESDECLEEAIEYIYDENKSEEDEEFYKIGINIDYYDDDYYVVVIKEYVTQDDEIREINFKELLEIEFDKKIKALKRFCEIMQITYEEPKWYLVGRMEC